MDLRRSPTHLRKDKKGSKKAAFISAGVPVTCYDIGPPTHQCRKCGATMWGRLCQQYLVDAYTAVYIQRLKWTRNNQDTLRVDLYHNLCDVVTRGDTSALGLGKRIVLPRTFTGSLSGVKGFDEMMTVNKRLYATFKETCFAYGLKNDDKELSHVIKEASLWALGPQLRDIFVKMLLFCNISIPLKLWEETWQTLSEDILGKKRKLFNYPNLQLTDEQIRNYCLMEIKDLLHKYGRSISDFKELPKPDPSLLTNMENRLIREALDFDIRKSKAEHQHLHSLLNPKQRLIDEDVIQSVHNKKSKFYIVYEPRGRGGTGKTFLYKTIISRLRSDRLIVLAIASSDGGIDTAKQEFNQWVLAVGDGTLPAKMKEGEDEPTWIDIPEKFLIQMWECLIHKIIEETYPDFNTRHTNDEYLKEKGNSNSAE
nr:ATP-dependent DNA helicase PIF2 [Tanacetum cinerariifolium]